MVGGAVGSAVEETNVNNDGNLDSGVRVSSGVMVGVVVGAVGGALNGVKQGRLLESARCDWSCKSQPQKCESGRSRPDLHFFGKSVIGLVNRGSQL